MQEHFMIELVNLNLRNVRFKIARIRLNKGQRKYSRRLFLLSFSSMILIKETSFHCSYDTNEQIAAKQYTVLDY